MKVYIGMDGDTAKRALEIGLSAPLPWPALRDLGLATSNESHTPETSLELTTVYAPDQAALRAHEQPWGIVEIDAEALDPRLLAPTRSWLEGFLVDRAGAGWMEIASLRVPLDEERLRAHAPLFRSLWRASMDAIGRCRYEGSIEPRAIRRVAIFDPTNNESLAAVANSTWDAAAHQLAARQQAALTDWFFQPVAPHRMLDSVEQALLVADPDSAVPELFWLRESARDRLAWWENVLEAREGLTVLVP